MLLREIKSENQRKGGRAVGKGGGEGGVCVRRERERGVCRLKTKGRGRKEEGESNI